MATSLGLDTGPVPGGQVPGYVRRLGYGEGYEMSAGVMICGAVMVVPE